MCNFQYVLKVDSKYRVVLVCKGMNFFFCVFFIDDGFVASDSENYFWSFIGFFCCQINLKDFLIVVVSDSKTLFRILEKFRLIICFCFVTIAFFLVCYPKYPIFVLVFCFESNNCESLLFVHFLNYRLT